MRTTAKHALEEAFFRDIDEMIMERLKEEAESPDERKALEALGLRDSRLISELAELGVTHEGLLALRLVPLVLVAWAEHGVDPAERKEVASVAKEVGIVDGSVASVLLQHWLDRRPGRMITDAWKRYTRSQLATMSPASKTRLINLLKEEMNSVARATGGHFGFGKVSHREQQVMDLVVRSLA